MGTQENIDRPGVGGGDKVKGLTGPGSDNPALEETYAHQTGDATTADLLRARESAEEERLRQAQAEIYADQSPTAGPEEWRNADSGRPNWPNDRDQSPAERLDSPRAESSYLAGSGAGGTGVDTMQIQAHAEALNDRAGGEAAKGEMPAATASPAAEPGADTYAEREWGRPTPPSDLDTLAPGMVNLPPEEHDGR